MRRLLAPMLVALTTTAHTQTPLTLELVAAGLQQPVFAAAPTGDFSRVFVVEQPGRIRIVRDGNLLPTPFLDLTGQISAGGERGLLGLAFHPDFATNRRFYVFATVNPYLHATVRGYTASATNPDLADPTSATTLLTVPLIYGNHNGGMLAFGPDHMLYVAIGDGGSIPPAWPSDPFNHAQRGDSLLGKLLRLDVDNPAPPLQYGIPAGNPFVGPGNPLDEIWALGLRNPWRFSFDRLTGDLWLADVGGQREEVNFRPAGSPGGQNYGWSCMAGTFCVNTGACVCGDPALTMPLHEYTATMSRAIIGGYVYRGAAIPDLRGTYFYADFSLGVIRSFQNQGGTVAQLVDRTAELNPPSPYQWTGVSSFGEDGRGELLVCDHSGQVYRIVPAAPVVVGISPYGSGTAGCNGAHALTAPTSPVVGNPSFALHCDHAPANGFGAMVLGAAPDLVGSDPFGIGVRLHVALAPPPLAIATLFADPQGHAQHALPLPAWPGLIGWTMHAQAAWLWPNPCPSASGGWSSSHGLTIVVQP
ncbi:MAG: hypothetical protein RL398_2377 [Planctomycetota bacterium]